MDVNLKQACEIFIKHMTSLLVSPLKSLLDKFDVVIELAGKESRDATKLILSQPFADPSTYTSQFI